MRRLILAFNLFVFAAISLFAQSNSPLPGKKFLLPHELTASDTVMQNFRFARLNPIDLAKLSKRTVDSNNECRTSTFYMRLAAPVGQKIDLKEIQTLPNGNFILAGNIILATAVREGMIYIMDNSGNLVSQRIIRVNNNPASINSMKILLSGQIVIAGIVNDAQDKAFISLLNADLSTNWVKIINTPLAPTKVTIDLLETEQLAFAVQFGGSIAFSLLDKNGTFVWSRQTNPTGLDKLVGFGSLLYSEMGLVANCTRAGKKVVEAFRINQTDGSVFFSHLIGDGTDENMYFETNTFASGRITSPAISKIDNGQFQLVRNIYYSSANIETEHRYSIPGNINFNVTGATDNAGDAIGFCLPQDGKMIFIRHFAYYQIAPEYIRQYNVPLGASLAAVTRSFADGGFLFGLNTANANELVLIKTDSIGILAGCGYTNIANIYTETLNKQNTISTNSTNAISLTSQASSISNISLSVSSITDCRQAYCPPPPPDDTCLNTYFKVLRSNSYADLFANYYLMRNNEQIALTIRYDRVLGQTNQLTYGLKKFDEKGHFLKGINFFINGTSVPVMTKQLDEEHLMVVYTFTINDIIYFTFTMINDGLQVIWTKTIETYAKYNMYSGGTGMGDFIKDKDGNYYFIANSLGFNEDAQILACKLNNIGNISWLKVFGIKDALLLTAAATATNTSLIIICEGGSNGSYSLNLDQATGNLKNIYQYKNNSAGAVYNRLVKFDTDRIFYAGNNGQSEFAMGLFDTTGLPLKLKYFDHAASITRAATVKSGNLYAMYQFFNGTGYKDVLLKADSSLAIKFINEFDIIRWGYPAGLAISDNGSIYSGGNYYYGGTNSAYVDPVIKKFDSNGSLGTCAFNTSNPGVRDAQLDISIPNYTELVRSFKVAESLIIDLIPDTNGQEVSELLCSSTPTCTSFDISGPDVICQFSKSYTYTASKNNGCALTPSWQYDTTFAVLESSFGNEATFKFRKPGTTWLKANINGGCTSLIDSFFVSIQNVDSTFSLGKDTVICPGDSLILNAGVGFNSYVWQDGSQSTTIVAKTDGKYFVQVENLCGDVYSDTLILSLAKVPFLDIGNDSTICAGDTLNLKANSGFASYLWKPAIVANNQNRETYIVLYQNENIFLEASTLEGCKSYDSIQINTIRAKPVFLGNDTSFCYSKSIQLSVSPSYTKYIWSTGNTSSFITVEKAGIYWIKAQDLNGCIAKDTMIVQQVYALPGFTLGTNFDLCENDLRILDPGIFASYNWQDGTTSRNYTIKTPGIYWVAVTDQNGCSSVDSITVDKTLPVPTNFLNSTDSICAYDKLLIQPLQSFNSYEWSTGSSQSSITVDEKGVYILKVTDSSGCIGKDTILITQKNDCYNDVYIPSAFTPNGDLLNDNFKASVPASIISFRLEVYNRNGERVFVTTDPKKGWDGLIKGILQPSSVFVWQCFFQLPGSKSSYKKGTVTLVR